MSTAEASYPLSAPVGVPWVPVEHSVCEHMLHIGVRGVFEALVLY